MVLTLDKFYLKWKSANSFWYHILIQEVFQKFILKTDRVKKHGQRFVTLYRMQWSRLSPRKRNANQNYKGISPHTSQNAAAAAAKSLQSCLTLCYPIDGSPPGSPVPGILQARTLECVAISFSNVWKWKVKVKSLSLSDSLQPHGLQPTRVLCPWDFPGKSTGVGCHCLLR